MVWLCELQLCVHAVRFLDRFVTAEGRRAESDTTSLQVAFQLVRLHMLHATESRLSCPVFHASVAGGLVCLRPPTHAREEIIYAQRLCVIGFLVVFFSSWEFLVSK